jgi:hypothetical protein
MKSMPTKCSNGLRKPLAVELQHWPSNGGVFLELLENEMKVLHGTSDQIDLGR